MTVIEAARLGNESSTATYARRRAEFIEDLEWLLRTDSNHDARHIAARLDISRDALLKRIYRAKRHDLVTHLTHTKAAS